jgi:hypothetical protein
MNFQPDFCSIMQKTVIAKEADEACAKGFAGSDSVVKTAKRTRLNCFGEVETKIGVLRELDCGLPQSDCRRMRNPRLRIVKEHRIDPLVSQQKAALYPSAVRYVSTVITERMETEIIPFWSDRSENAQRADLY